MTAMLNCRNVNEIRTMWRALALALFLTLSIGAGAQSQWQIAISSPASGETVHDNEGNVAVAVAIEGAGERPAIRLLLDGRPHGVDQSAPSFALENIDRGEHTLQAQLIDARGQVIADSQPVTFYLWRASALFKSRKK